MFKGLSADWARMQAPLRGHLHSLPQGHASIVACWKCGGYCRACVGAELACSWSVGLALDWLALAYEQIHQVSCTGGHWQHGHGSQDGHLHDGQLWHHKGCDGDRPPPAPHKNAGQVVGLLLYDPGLQICLAMLLLSESAELSPSEGMHQQARIALAKHQMAGICI